MTTFPSRVDAWLGVLVVSVPVIALGAAVATSLTEGLGAAVAAWVALAAIVAMYVGVVWPVRYELARDALVIRFGLLRTQVPYSQITRVSASRNPLASPAMSLKRIEISSRGYRSALISPRDRPAFVRALRERAPHIEVDPRLEPER